LALLKTSYLKRTSLIAFLIGIFIHSSAQQKNFEGTIIYSVQVKSRTKDLDDNFYMLLLAANGNKLTVQIKDGNYKQSIGVLEAFYIREAKRVYLKFKNIDTLYYRDYSSDTTRVTEIIKSDSLALINNFQCKSILIKRSNYSSRYFYTSSLHLNPEYDKDNSIENLNVFSKETGGAVWLYCSNDYNTALLTDSCIHLEQKNVDIHVFDLPSLPQKNILKTSVFIQARFPGKENAWNIYLRNNLNASLAIKYIKLAKGLDTAFERVMVSFVVSEDGTISKIEVKNKEQVHSKLAEEAMRVIRESPRWVPSTIYGVKTKFTVNQPVVFAVNR
jgi:hypothetical protein